MTHDSKICPVCWSTYKYLNRYVCKHHNFDISTILLGLVHLPGADHALDQDPVQAQAPLLQDLDQVQQLARQGQDPGRVQKDPGRVQNLEMKMRPKHHNPKRRLKISLVTIFQSAPMMTTTMCQTNRRKSQ